MGIEARVNHEDQNYLKNGREGGAENLCEDDREEEICVKDACSCENCFDRYADIMFKPRKTDSEKLVEDLLASNTKDTSKKSRSTEIGLDIEQVENLQLATDCETSVNHLAKLRMSSPKYEMFPGSEFVTYQQHQSNGREHSLGPTAYSYENVDANNHSLSYRKMIKSHWIYGDVGENNQYCKSSNHYDSDYSNASHKSRLQRKLSLDQECDKLQCSFGTTPKSRPWVESSVWSDSIDLDDSRKSDKQYRADITPKSRPWVESNIWNDSLDIHHSRRTDEQYQADLTPESRPCVESSVWSDSLAVDDSRESDEQYQADISANLDESCENYDLINESTQYDSQYLMVLIDSNGFPRYVLLDVVQGRRTAVDSRERYYYLDTAKMQRARHEQQEQRKDAGQFEETKLSFNIESSLSHKEIWTPCCDLDSPDKPCKWKQSLRPTQDGYREQIREYFEEPNTKFVTTWSLPTARSNNWQTGYDFLDNGCTSEYNDQYRANLVTNFDETLTHTASGSDLDDVYNTTRERIVRPRRTQNPHPEARPTSKAERVSQMEEYAQFEQSDSDERVWLWINTHFGCESQFRS